MLNHISHQGNVNQNRSTIQNHCRMATIKNNYSIGEDVKKLEPSYITGGNIKWCSTLENSLAAPQNV